jgi:O-antigen ligase
LRDLIQDIKNTGAPLKILGLSYILQIALGTASGQINVIVNQIIIWIIIPGLFVIGVKNTNLNKLPKDHVYYILLILFFVICYPLVLDHGRFMWTFRKMIMSLMMLIIVLQLIKTDKAASNILFLSIFTGTLILCIMSYGEIGTTEVYVSDEGSTKEVTKIGDENTINTNALAIIAGNGILATLYLIHAYSKIKWIFLSFTFFFIVIIIACGSKSGFINMAMSFALWYLLVQTSSSKYKGIYFVIFGILIYLLITYFSSLLEGTYLLERFNRVDSLNKYYENDSRGKLFQQGLELFLEHPIFGVGLGQVGIYMNAAYTHNDLAEILSNGGTIGTLLYFFFLIVIYRRTITVHKALEKAGLKTYHTRFMQMLFWVLMVRGISAPLFFSFDEMFMLGIISAYSYVHLNSLITNKKDNSTSVTQAIDV